MEARGRSCGQQQQKPGAHPDPLFLRNFVLFARGVLSDVFITHYFDPAEVQQLKRLLELPRDALKLLARLVQRKRRPLFRVRELEQRYGTLSKSIQRNAHSLSEKEISDVAGACRCLRDAGLFGRYDEAVDASEGVQLLTAVELRQVLDASGIGVPRCVESKGVAALREHVLDFCRAQSRRTCNPAPGSVFDDGGRLVDEEIVPSSSQEGGSSPEVVECSPAGNKAAMLPQQCREEVPEEGTRKGTEQGSGDDDIAFVGRREQDRPRASPRRGGARRLVQQTLGGRRLRIGEELAKAVGPCVAVSETLCVLLDVAEFVFFLGKDMSVLTISTLAVVRYPQYEVVREVPLFESRGALRAFMDALALEVAFEQLVGQGDDDAALSLVRPVLEELAPDCGMDLGAERGAPQPETALVRCNEDDDNKNRRLFLRRFTGEWVRTRIAHHALPLLQRRQAFGWEVCILVALLRSPLCPDRRGMWYNRLALDLTHHLKMPDAALSWCLAAMRERDALSIPERVRLEHRYRSLLSARRRRLGGEGAGSGLGKTKRKVDTTEGVRGGGRWRKVEGGGRSRSPPPPVVDATRSCCDGDVAEVAEHSARMGAPVLDVEQDTNETEMLVLLTARERVIEGDVQLGGVGKRVLCRGVDGNCRNVEEFALEEYLLQDDWEDGVHAEGRVWHALFALLFWECLFAPVPDMFQTPYQTHPLDLHCCGEFYRNRKSMIDARCTELREMSAEELVKDVRMKWMVHEGEACVGVNWEAYPLSTLCAVALCAGGNRLQKMLRVLCTGYSWWAGGMPDLTLWNMASRSLMLVEVKSTNDRLADKQRAWIDHLLRCGVDVEVALVRQRPSTPVSSPLVADAADVPPIEIGSASS